MSLSSPRPRLAVLPDFPEEGWPSMDLCADMLLQSLINNPSCPFEIERVCPPFRRRFTRLPWFGRRRAALNADRLLNRFRYYPRQVRARAAEFAAFHICDHSYSQLVHALPPGRAGVYCHDLDTFRCILQPDKERRPAWFRRMMQRTLDGMRKAAIVFHTTSEIGRQIATAGIVDPARLVHAPNGVAPEFTPDVGSEDAAPLPDLEPGPFLLHVGSCIQRKRIDVLLDLFAAVRRERPEVRLLQVGGEWTAEQRQQIEKLEIASSLRQVRGIARTTLAALYRRAGIVLVTSDAEGFGLPVIEALACGAALIASDIPVLREVGGDAIGYCGVADLSAWTPMALNWLAHPDAAPPRELRLTQASQFTWARQARIISEGYARLLG